MDREFRAVIGLGIVLSIFYIAMAIHEYRSRDLPEYKEFTDKKFTRFRTNYRSWRYFTDVYLKSPNRRSENKRPLTKKVQDQVDKSREVYRHLP